jgi:hypothetical protein
MVIGEKILTCKSCHGDKNFTFNMGELTAKNSPTLPSMVSPDQRGEI